MSPGGKARGRSLALLQQAASAHQRGDVAEARRLAKQILRKEPDQFDALHLLGIVEAERGHFDKAMEWIRKALAVNARSAEAHANLGNVARAANRLDDALASFDTALAIRPDYANAWNGRGQTLLALERFTEGLACFDRALAQAPGSAGMHYNRAITLIAMRRPEEALTALAQATERDPGFALAHAERSKVLVALGRPAEALLACDRAVQIAPGMANFHYDRGLTLASLGRHEAALASFDRALALDPRFAAAWINRGGVLEQLGRPAEALASLDQALTVAPDDPTALLNRGAVLSGLGRLSEALASYERACALGPTAGGFYGLGTALETCKRFSDAAAAFRSALAIDPGCKYALGRLVHTRMHACDWDGLSADIERMCVGIRAGAPVADPFTLLSAGSRSDDQLQCATIYVADRYPAAAQPLAPATGVPAERERIRLAYVSGEFREQATAYLTAELFELHDRSRFEIIGISTGPDDLSPMRHRLQAGFDTFIDGQALSDHELARRIHAADIDILVNLNGYFGIERTGVFALRPCPIQVSYLGFPGTLGAGYIDYVIADREVIPPDQQAFFAEKVVYLPHSYQANDSRRRVAEHTLTRTDAGLPASGMVFCCFNNNHKITPEIFTIWMRLLREVDGVLWLLAGNEDAVRNLRAEAERLGVAGDRLVFAPMLPLADHLARHRRAALSLDTLPHNAHTTASDALWAGLPVLTCRGSTFAGRVGASLLAAVGLQELITTSLVDYEAMALALATAPALLAGFKARLARRESAPLFDSRRLCRDIEAAYVTMWTRWQRGEPPASFAAGDD